MVKLDMLDLYEHGVKRVMSNIYMPEYLYIEYISGEILLVKRVTSLRDPQ